MYKEMLLHFYLFEKIYQAERSNTAVKVELENFILSRYQIQQKSN